MRLLSPNLWRPEVDRVRYYALLSVVDEQSELLIKFQPARGHRTLLGYAVYRSER